jgi:acyl CoA:acetate/3-ketoacid CoA transferase alpha subunit
MAQAKLKELPRSWFDENQMVFTFAQDGVKELETLQNGALVSMRQIKNMAGMPCLVCAVYEGTPEIIKTQNIPLSFEGIANAERLK